MANGHGGIRKGSGRKKGGVNSDRLALAARAAAEGITPLEVMIQTMRTFWGRAHEVDPPDMQLQVAACAVAEKAAPFIHPRLAAVTHRGDPNKPLTVDADPMLFARRVAFLLTAGAQVAEEHTEH